MSARQSLVAVAITVALGFVLPARADLPGKVLIGLNQLGYDNQITRNYLGDGYDFNAAAPYSGRTFHLNLADLTLGAGSPSVVQIATGYTTRFLPEAHFSLSTLGSPLGYTFDFNNGIQDFVATGTVSFNISTRINALGFYDETIQISNRGTYTTDGFGPNKTGPTDSDIGPINVSGNIYADIAAALTQPFFDATGTVNPFAKFSEKATKVTGYSGTVEDLLSQAASGDKLSDDQFGKLVNNSILSAILGKSDPTANLFDNLVMPTALLDQFETQDAALAQERSLLLAPEPTTIALFVLAGLVCLLPRRHARRVQG